MGERLSHRQARELAKSLAHAEKENRVQMHYASEYGEAAVKYQRGVYEREVAHIKAKYKELTDMSAIAKLPLGVSMGATAPVSLSPAVWCVGSGLPLSLF